MAIGVGLAILVRDPDPKIRLATFGIVFATALGWGIFRAIRPKSAERGAAANSVTWMLPWWLWIPDIFVAKRHEDWERAAFERRDRIARRAENTAQATEKTDTTTAKVTCRVCQHVQTVPISQETFSCEQCNAHLERRTAPQNSS
jgi:hypothetical protein